MNEETRDVKTDERIDRTDEPPAPSDAGRLRFWVNWVLALLTVVAGLAVVVSFFTARRQWGIVVPVCALALLVVDITILAVTFTQ
jgi:uncharacterized membrane protein YhaH (DUF805 family)